MSLPDTGSAADVDDRLHGGRQAQSREKEARTSKLRRSTLTPTTAPGLEPHAAGAAPLEVALALL